MVQYNFSFKNRFKKKKCFPVEEYMHQSCNTLCKVTYIKDVSKSARNKTTKTDKEILHVAQFK